MRTVQSLGIVVTIALAVGGCETRRTYASDRTPRRSMITDPFGGATLMTGTDFHEAKDNKPDHADAFFKIPKRE